MRLRVVVVGIPGVGKSTVVDGAVAGMKGSRAVNFGSVMFEEGQRMGWVRNRDDMRKLTVERQKRLQSVAAAKISRMKDPAVFVDTHLFIRTGEGFWPGLPINVAQGMKPTHIVLVEASPEEILARRKADGSRSRDALNLDDLRDEISLGRGFASVASTLTGAPLLVVKNSEGKASQAAEFVVRALREASR